MHTFSALPLTADEYLNVKKNSNLVPFTLENALAQLTSVDTPEIWRSLEVILLDSKCSLNSNVLDKSDLFSFLLKLLEVSPLSDASAYYHPLRILNAINFDGSASEIINQFIAVGSCHSTATFLPWTSKVNAVLATNFMRTQLRREGFSFLSFIQQDVVPNLLTLGKPHQRATSRRSPPPAGGGLKPTLGFSSAEDTRENWKQSKLVVSIPMVSFLLQYKKDLEAEAGGGSCSWFFEYWPVFTSFVLNVLEDHDPKFKEAGCGMLSLMILLDERISKSDETVFIKSGLVDVFNDAAKVCLSYLPNLTPVEVSDRLLTAAYGVIIPLIRMKRESVAGKRLRYVQLLNENILSSIQHISSSNSSHPVLITLLKQISILIKLDPLFIFIPLTRLLFTINQIMTNPITLEDHAHGYLVIEECLKIQSHVLNKNTLPYDKVACALILQYKYDFLAVSCVLYLRLTKYHQHNQHIIQIIKRNVILLEEIYKEVEPIQWINDIEKICSRDNQLYPLFKVLM